MRQGRVSPDLRGRNRRRLCSPCHAFPVSEPMRMRVVVDVPIRRHGQIRGRRHTVNTRPARSKREPWHGQIEAARPIGAEIGVGPASKRGIGAQPRWVHTPSRTRYSGLQRAVLVRGVARAGSDAADAGSRRRSDVLRERARASPRCGARCRSAWPRHSTLSSAPVSSLLMSTSTGAPNAWARALGFQEETNGTAVNEAPTPPVTRRGDGQEVSPAPSTPSSKALASGLIRTFSGRPIPLDPPAAPRVRPCLAEAASIRVYPQRTGWPGPNSAPASPRFQRFTELRIIHTTNGAL